MSNFSCKVAVILVALVVAIAVEGVSGDSYVSAIQITVGVTGICEDVRRNSRKAATIVTGCIAGIGIFMLHVAKTVFGEASLVVTHSVAIVGILMSFRRYIPDESTAFYIARGVTIAIEAMTYFSFVITILGVTVGITIVVKLMSRLASSGAALVVTVLVAAVSVIMGCNSRLYTTNNVTGAIALVGVNVGYFSCVLAAVTATVASVVKYVRRNSCLAAYVTAVVTIIVVCVRDFSRISAVLYVTICVAVIVKYVPCSSIIIAEIVVTAHCLGLFIIYSAISI